MYSESDIDGAVTAGALTPAAAASFRDHVAASRAAPAVDEEHFRLLTGFNDIFVSIALVLLLVALGQIGQRVAAPIGGALVAGAAWMLAEFFTARRRMALPSILLLLAFVGGTAAATAGLLLSLPGTEPTERTGSMIAAATALVATGAAWLHWRRFAVPITIAAGALSATVVAVALIVAAVPTLPDLAYPLLLAGGVAVFALAMRWDLSDPRRQTRRADVAFWLHLAAAPLIAHPLFHLLGVLDGEIGAGTALGVLALYLLFAGVALAVDRRALLVSSLAYVLYALFALLRGAGAVELGWAVTALVIGSALLTLSAFWQPMRRAVVARMGGWGDRLPPVPVRVG